MVTFVFTNPGHHLQAMAPVAEQLRAMGHPVRLVSLAELRGFRTPEGRGLIRALPPFRRSPQHGRALVARSGGNPSTPAHRVLESLLRPRLRWLARDSDVVVLPNDSAWPYGRIARSLRRRHVPFVLMQEGIRFPLPGETERGAAYGTGGAAAIACWGEASAEHFRRVAPSTRSVVTGTPRFDGVDPAEHQAAARALLGELGEQHAPLLFLSNPVDDMGYCTTEQKMALFRGAVERVGPRLAARGRALLVKLHPREDLGAFRDASVRAPCRVHVVDAPLFSVLAAGQSAVVLASTVGLEAMLFGQRLGVVALPGHGHVFEYVTRGGALALWHDRDESWQALVDGGGDDARRASFVERHLAHRGGAARRVAEVVTGVARRQD